MHCKHCKNAIEEEHIFCPHCGEKIERVVQEETELVEPNVVTEEETPIDVEKEPKPKGSAITSTSSFTILLFSIMFIFSILAVVMSLQTDREIQSLQHQLAHLKNQQVQTTKQDLMKSRITVAEIGHLSTQDTYTVLLNMHVPDDAYFNGVSVQSLTSPEKTAFASALMKSNWSLVQHEVQQCYAHTKVELKLLVNGHPYALYNGQAIELLK